MSTARDIIQSAMEMIGVYAPGQIVIDADAQRGLDQLNKMLDTWSNESLTAFAILEQSFAITITKTRYTIGKTGARDIDQIRPIRIMEGPGAAYLQDTNSNNYKVNVVPRDEWNQIANRGGTVVSNIPNTLFYDPQFPLGVINIWPSPTAAYTLFFDSYQQLGNLANLAASLSFPPGYEAAIQSNLAGWLAPFFKSAALSEDVKDLARYTKKIIKRTNRRSNRAQFDAELTRSGQGNYNIWSDSYNTTAR